MPNEVTQSVETQKWNGQPKTLKTNEPALKFSNTVVGDMVIVLQNQVAGSSTISVEISSGSQVVKNLELTPNPDGLPVVFIHNFNGDNVQVANLTEGSLASELTVAAIGPGMYQTEDLPADSKEHALTPIFAHKCSCDAPFSREGSTPASTATLRFGQHSANAAAFVLFKSSKALIYGVNWPGDKPADYEEVTPKNTISLRKNFMGDTVTVSNVSPNTSGLSFVQLKDS